jgi:amino acid adenylation domain-containing protein
MAEADRVLGGEGSGSLSEAKRRLLERCLRGDQPPHARDAITRRPEGAPIPLSYGQQLLWLHTQLAPDLPVYNEPITVHRKGPLDVLALERSLNEIVRRHEAWRTSFVTVGARQFQAVHEAATLTLPVVDLRTLPPDEREAEALRLATEDARRPFDLAHGPLLRAKLVRLGDEEHRLFMTLHHIIFDGVSTYGVFLPELTALYEAYSAGRPSPLPELQIQYGDYAFGQRQKGKEGLSDAIAYWRDRLLGAPDLELPTDRPRPPVQSFRGGMQPLRLEKGLSAALRALARREGVTLFITLLATFKTLLHRETGQEDLVVGTVTAGRDRPEIQKLLGFFLNPLILRTDLAGNPTFREVLQRVRRVALDALSHEEAPFELLVKDLRPARDPSRNPLYQVLFSLEPPMPVLQEGWTLTQTDIETGTAKLDLYLELDDRPEGIVGRFMYNSDLFDKATIERLLGHWETLLAGVVRDPDRAISRLPLMTEGERRRLSLPSDHIRPRNPFVPFERDETEQTLSRRFEAVAAAHEARLAVETGREAWTYGALNRRANQIARGLLKLRGEGEERVALLLDHDPKMIAGILGVLKAGKTYLPLDPRFPRERIAYVLRDAEATAVVTNRANLPLGRELGALPTLDIDAIDPKTPGENIGLPGDPGALAYLLYTSGSTGRPKGVMQSHRNLLAFIRIYTNELRIRADDRLTLVSSFSFDAALMDTFGALLNGATLCPIDIRAEGLSGFAAQLQSLGVTIYHSVPTVYRALVSVRGAEDFSRIRLVVLGGEEVNRTDVLLYRKHFSPEALLVNLQGQTESSVNFLNFLDKKTAVVGTAVPIGYPVDLTEVSFLGEDGEETEICGEIAIRSAHLALGYWGQEELSRRAFRADPEGGQRRLYRTGDRGRLLSDGRVLSLGRKDLQVKVRGVRIELGEIETVLSQHPSVAAVAAAAWEVAPGEKRLVAYWVPKGLPAIESGALRDFLRERLPESMVPSTFVLLDALPLTPTGKVDRRALLPPASGGSKDELARLAPRDALEGQLVRIFERVLSTSAVSVQDDFFDLGGHSLLAVQLFSLLEKTFGIRIPLATLFKAPTVERLAEVLRQQAKEARWSALVPLQPAGRRPPFFGVHGHSGEVLFYRELSLRLGGDQPFFALQSQGLSGKPAHRSIAAMAAHYIEEIRSVQPRGPYFLGGYCLGAFVAFEMAQQLRDVGEEVALLGLFVGYRKKRTLPERLLRFGRRFSAHLRESLSRQGRARLAYLLEKGRGETQALKKATESRLWRLAYGTLGNELPSFLLRNVGEMNLQAARDYVPKTYPGRMTVFLSGEIPPDVSLDPARDLDGLVAREMDVVRVPGTTDTMLKEPHVSFLSAQLKTCLLGGAAKDSLMPERQGQSPREAFPYQSLSAEQAFEGTR